MPKLLSKTLFLTAIFIAFQLSANGQESKRNLALKTLVVGKKASVFVVKKSAKVGYKVTKFTAVKIAKPIIVKSAPKVAKFTLKQSGNILKRSFPIGKKLFVKYIKYKFLP